LTFKQDAHQASIAVPRQAPDANATVIAIEL
jgi:hypothetical protein